MRKKLHTYAKATVFAALVVAVHLSLRHFYFTQVLALEFPIQRDRAFADVVDETDIGLLGNSHVGLQLTPEDIPRSYNLAWLGEGYIVTYYRLKSLIKEHGRPFDTLVLQVDQHSFAYQQRDQSNSPYSALHVDYLDVIRRTGQPRARSVEWLRHRAFPYAGHMEEIARYFLAENETVQEQLELLDEDFSSRGDPDGEAHRLATFLFRRTTWYSEDMAQYLVAILDLCRQHEIQVVLIRFPLSGPYWRQVANFMPLDEWDTNVAELLADRRNVTILDYHDLYFDRDDLFMDPHHLNKQGVEIFSARVGRDLRDLGLCGPAGRAQ